MNLHEQAFVENFIDPRRRGRFLEALASPKRRKLFHRELDHPKEMFLLAKYIENLASGQHFPRFVAPKLREMGAPDLCWVFGNYVDGQEMKLEEALKAVIGWGEGTIISCLPGKLAYFEAERERFIPSQGVTVTGSSPKRHPGSLPRKVRSLPEYS